MNLDIRKNLKPINVGDKVIAFYLGDSFHGEVTDVRPFQPCGLRSRYVNKITIKIDEMVRKPHFKDCTWAVTDDPEKELKVCHYEEEVWLKIKERTTRRAMVDFSSRINLMEEIYNIIKQARKV